MYTIRQGERTDYNYKEIFCDTQNDFDTLDLNSAEFQKICAGSVAYVIETSNVYILNSKGEWVAQSSGGGGGGDIHNQNKTITENGEYTADLGYTGLGTVTVDVPQPTGVINITNNGTYDVEKYETAEVNVSGGSGHDWSTIGYSGEPQDIQDGYDYAVQVKNNWVTSSDYGGKFRRDTNLIYMPMVDTSQGTKFSSMFNGCTSLVTVPLLNTSNCTIFQAMFQNCSSLRSVPTLNTSQGMVFTGMFSGCSALLTAPTLDTSRATTLSDMFYQCISLTTAPTLDTHNCSWFDYMFAYCTSLTTVPLLDMSYASKVKDMFTECRELTTLGGFKNLGLHYDTTKAAHYSNYTLDLSLATKLTHDSLMNVINNLYDIASKGVQPQQLKLGSSNKAKLSADEIAIATNKGWSVS